MQPQENPARVLLGLHVNSIEGFLLRNLFCLECMAECIVVDISSTREQITFCFDIVLWRLNMTVGGFFYCII